jgi:hypothetical protein
MFLEQLFLSVPMTIVLVEAGNAKGGSITILLIFGLTGLDYSVLQMKT